MAINKEYDDVQLDVKFTQASTRANLVSEENISVSFGKLAKWYEALVPSGGSSGQFLGWNSDGTAKWVSNPNSDTKVTDTVGTANTYYPAGLTGTSTATGTQVFDTSFKFVGTTGTTSAVGKAQLVLGNSTPSGSANNKQGSLVVYGSTAYAHTIQGAPTAARTLTLPDKTGTFALTSDIPSIPPIPTVNDAALTLKGAGTTVTTFTANASSPKSLDIVAGSNVTVTADATNSKISIASSHPTITKSTDTTSTVSPAHGGTFTTVDTVTRDEYGHVTKINTKTVTLPSDQNTDTLVSQTFATASNKRPLLMSYYKVGEAAGTAQVAYRNDSLYCNPSNGRIFATGFYTSGWDTSPASTSASLQTNGLVLRAIKTYGDGHTLDYNRYVVRTYSGKTGLNTSDWSSNGMLVTVEGGGLTIVGGGESAASLANLISDDYYPTTGDATSLDVNGDTTTGTGYYHTALSGSSEALILSADVGIYFATNCNTITARRGAYMSAGLEFYPMSTNTGSIGTSTYQWNTIYGKTLYENGTSLASKYSAVGHTHTLSIATDSGTNQLTLAASTKYKLTAGGSTYIFTTPPNTTYTFATGDAIGQIKVTPSGGTATNYNVNGIAAGTSSGTAKRLAYYDSATSITSAGNIIYSVENSTASTPRSRTILHIFNGNTVGNDASALISGTKGVLSYGDGGPQINFSTGATIGGAQDSAIIWTDNDSAAAGASWHFVSSQTDWNVISKRFHARTGISIGTDLPNTSYNLYVNGTSQFNGTATMSTNAFGTQLIVERSGSSNYASLGFKNNLGMLGYIGANAVDANLYHVYAGDTSKQYIILDTGNTSVTTSGSGNAITALSFSNGTFTATKGSTFSLSTHTHTTTIAADSGTNQLTLAASTKYKLTAGETNFIFTTPPNTDTKVTSSANHYTPSTASGSDKSASASGATAAWSIDVVKGVTLNTDGKGHVTGISVTSGKIPANPIPANNVTGSAAWTAADRVLVTNAASGNVIKQSAYTIATSVPENALFTDTVTTATTTGSGNAVTSITASNGALTVTKGSTFSLSTHAHGMLNSSFAQAASDASNTGWSILGIDPSTNGYILKSVRVNTTATDWLSGDYGAGIAFGGSDTKGVISMKHNSPVVVFAAGNHNSSTATAPKWYIKLSGTSGSTYNLDNYLGAVKIGNYWGMAYPDGTATGTSWIRTTRSGIIPYAANSDTTDGNVSSLGTSTWTFNNGYINNIYYKDLKTITVVAGGDADNGIDKMAGSYFFSGGNLFGGVNDWVGIQIGYSADKWQLVGNGGSGVMFRQNDTGGTNTSSWSAFKALMIPDNVTGSGGITVTKTTTTLGSGDTALVYDKGVSISHSNSVTARTNYDMPYVKYDAQGHVTDASHWTATASGTGGEDGWIKIATMIHTQTYDNTPIMLTISQRGNTITYRLHIQFSNTNSTDPPLGKFILASDEAWGTITPEAYIIKSATSTWDLYIKKLDSYEAVAISRFDVGRYFTNHMSWTWQNVQTAESAITGGTEATKKTYLSTAGGTSTGPITISSPDFGNQLTVTRNNSSTAYASIAFKNAASASATATTLGYIGMKSSDGDLYRIDGSNTGTDHQFIILDTNNYTTYTVKKDGTGASGTWGINISGNVQHTKTNPTSETLYGLTFHANANTAEAKVLRTNDGLRHLSREGTTSQSGYGFVVCGNNVASGSAGNKYGGIRLYGNSTTYVQLSAGAAANTIRFSQSGSTAGSNISPATTNVYDLGTSSLKWRNVYATTFNGSLSGTASGVSAAGLVTAIYGLEATSSTATFDGAETLITSLPSASGTSTPNYQRVTVDKFAKTIHGRTHTVLYNHTGSSGVNNVTVGCLLTDYAFFTITIGIGSLTNLYTVTIPSGSNVYNFPLIWGGAPSGTTGGACYITSAWIQMSQSNNTATFTVAKKKAVATMGSSATPFTVADNTTALYIIRIDGHLKV